MGCPTTSSTDYLSCVGLQPRFTEEQVQVYADRAGASGAPWVRPMTIAFLRVNRVVYWKKTPSGLTGDCGAPTTSGISGFGVAGSALGTAARFDPEPISQTILGGISAVFGFLTGANHARAVATEQQTICNVAGEWNTFADQMEQAIAQNKIPLQDAVSRLQAFGNSVSSALTAIEKPYNAPYGYNRAVKALVLFNTEVVYPSLAPSAASKIFSPTNLLIGGGALVGAKVLGVL